MKKILFVMSVVLISMACVAEDRPLVYEQLPAPAKEFINANYPGEKVSYVVVDDDVIKPDYTVRLANGVEIQFENSGALEKITARTGVPEAVVPVQISDYVEANFPDTVIVEYEVGRRDFSVDLSNGLELRFNGKFKLVELDD
ncbi:MAG: hypothetical protein E7113_06530 [Bacteroidales bacterium]|nr:hypothetical protein [Bacteroidales bacterium]